MRKNRSSIGKKRERERERICEEDEETIICSRTPKGRRLIATDLGRARFAEQASRPHGRKCPGLECKPSILRERLLGFETLYHA